MPAVFWIYALANTWMKSPRRTWFCGWNLFSYPLTICVAASALMSLTYLLLEISLKNCFCLLLWTRFACLASDSSLIGCSLRSPPQSKIFQNFWIFSLSDRDAVGVTLGLLTKFATFAAMVMSLLQAKVLEAMLIVTIDTTAKPTLAFIHVWVIVFCFLLIMVL